MKAYIMVGVPHSGKSYFTKNILKNSNNVIISSDDYIQDKANKENKTYSEVFNQYINDATNYMNNQLVYAINNGFDIIWDQTNLTKRKRSTIISKIPKEYSTIHCISFMFPNDIDKWKTALKVRGINEGKSIPDSAIDYMLKSYQEPTKDEGFHSVTKIVSYIG